MRNVRYLLFAPSLLVLLESFLAAPLHAESAFRRAKQRRLRVNGGPNSSLDGQSRRRVNGGPNSSLDGQIAVRCDGTRRPSTEKYPQDPESSSPGVSAYLTDSSTTKYPARDSAGVLLRLNHSHLDRVPDDPCVSVPDGMINGAFSCAADGALLCMKGRSV